MSFANDWQSHPPTLPNKACSRLLNRGDFDRWYRVNAFPRVNRFAFSGG